MDAEDAGARRRPWIRLAGLGMLAGLVVGLGVTAIGLGPYVWDDVALDRIVRVVALDWRDFGEDKARERLEYELDHRGIGLHVRDDDCRLSTEDDGVRWVRCLWTIQLRVPATAIVVPLGFRSEVHILSNGELAP